MKEEINKSFFNEENLKEYQDILLEERKKSENSRDNDLTKTKTVEQKSVFDIIKNPEDEVF